MAKKPEKPRMFTRLTPAEKEEIREHWKLGTFTGEELTRRYGVSTGAIARTTASVRHGEKETEIKRIATEAAEKIAVDKTQTHQERVVDVKEQAYKRTDTLLRLLMREIGKAATNGIPMGTIAPDVKTLKMALEAVKDDDIRT